MGAVCSTGSPEEKAARAASRTIDRQMRDDLREAKNEIKMLLLGPGESGKSTVFKQMKIISSGNGFTRDELMASRVLIYANCITQMKVLVFAAQNLGIELDEPNRGRAQNLAQLPATGEAWSKQVADDILALWHDRGIQNTFVQRDRKFQLNDSAQYFFDRVETIAEPTFCPKEQDILRARVRSVGIEEAQFAFDDLAFRMVDVGGQRSERRKWIHCFDSVTAVLFCVALSEYDQTLREDEGQNRMKESLLLFDEIINSPWFQSSAFILFLNKVDIFREKITRVNLSVCFPGYPGPQTFEAASAFIRDRFLELNHARRPIYSHFTCAINTENIEFVFRCVRASLLEDILRNW